MNNNIIYFSVFKQKKLILNKNVIFFPNPECESFILKCSEYFTLDSWETGNIYTLIFIASSKPIEILSTNSYRCLSGNFLFSKQVPKDIGEELPISSMVTISKLGLIHTSDKISADAKDWFYTNIIDMISSGFEELELKIREELL